ncbi:MAG: DNA repair protein RecN [Planctomycetota bacterium]
MLVQLQVRNLGLIETADLEFGSGLEVITGETGVGKTMLLGAVNILAGARARTEWIREGADEARVSGFFSLTDPELIARIEDATGVDVEDGALLIERRLRVTGRHRTLLNGREIPLSLLSEVARHLIEIHGQRAQLSLLRSADQLELVDRFAGLLSEREAFRTLFGAARDAAARIDAIRARQRERNDRRLYLGHMLRELDGAEIVRGELATLERELALLEERDAILQLIATTEEGCSEGESCILDSLGVHAAALKPFAALHPSVAEVVAGFAAAEQAIQDAVQNLRTIGEGLGDDPERLAQLRRRVDQVQELEQRFRRNADQLVDYREELRAEYDALEGEDAELPALESQLTLQLEELGTRARALGRKRRTAATRLARAVVVELRELGMPEARFEVKLSGLVATTEGEVANEADDASGDEVTEAATTRADWLGFNKYGADRVDLEFGPNPGESAHPLREIASGGELSRVLLALKAVIAEVDGTRVLVFDEIDAGVGGRLGSILGQKLKRLAARRQVLCVTHLPQIACYGDHHLHVTKQVKKGRTTTSIEPLVDERRVSELAAMMRGASRSELSLAEAREMLAEARE